MNQIAADLRFRGVATAKAEATSIIRAFAILQQLFEHSSMEFSSSSASIHSEITFKHQPNAGPTHSPRRWKAARTGPPSRHHVGKRATGRQKVKSVQSPPYVDRAPPIRQNAITVGSRFAKNGCNPTRRLKIALPLFALKQHTARSWLPLTASLLAGSGAHTRLLSLQLHSSSVKSAATSRQPRRNRHFALWGTGPGLKRRFHGQFRVPRRFVLWIQPRAPRTTLAASTVKYRRCR